MCGIAGLIGRPPEQAGGAVRRMLAAIAHRGPDDEGVWQEGAVCLGQRRLSIIDTSPAGHQPMQSACGRYVITINGEIYNYRDLRRELDASGHVSWRGHSDTETFLETIARHGVAPAARLAKGMFAFALWDRQTRTSYLARDRLGEKPLYYSADASGLAFASELTGLETLQDTASDLSPAALGAFFRYGYIPAPLSIRQGVKKLEPGMILTWREGHASDLAPYWRLEEVIEAGRANRLANDEAAVEALDQLLRRVIARQMTSDVPLGSFLSGGIDSSLVTGVMQALSPTPVRTFTLGFESPEFNEAEHAREVARHLGTDHTEHTVTVADAQAIAPRLGHLYDEPFADSSQIPAYLVSQMARRHVKVCLTGDGGDETFGGYVRYPGVNRLWNAMRRMPARRLAARGLGALPLPVIDRAMGWLGPLARQYASRGALGPSVRRAAGWLRADTREALFEATMTFWSDPLPLRSQPVVSPGDWRPARPAFDNDIEPMLWRDMVDYLPGDILCKVDRAAMANGLETRAPLLDADVINLAWRTPPEMKIRGAQTKWLVRRVLERYVPPALTERPKLGFTVPLREWLTGGLRPWALDLIDPTLIRRQGLLDPARVEAAWRGLEAGDSGLGQPVWSVLMFQAWLSARRG